MVRKVFQKIHLRKWFYVFVFLLIEEWNEKDLQIFTWKIGFIVAVAYVVADFIFSVNASNSFTFT